jgi:hypothetical protein
MARIDIGPFCIWLIGASLRCQAGKDVLSGRVSAAIFIEYPLGRCRVLRQFVCGSPGARNQFAAAVRADALKHVVRAIDAERAFEGANASIGRIGRKIFITAFTTGA